MILLYEAAQQVPNTTKENHRNDSCAAPSPGTALVQPQCLGRSKPYQTHSPPQSCLIQGFQDSIKAHLRTVCCPWLHSSKTQTTTPSQSHMVMGIKKLSKVFYLLSFFQQYIMLHDMVAAHSIVRVSVCRANNGLSIFFCFLRLFFFFADGLCRVIFIVVHCMYYPTKFPAFLESALQTEPDSRHFSASVLGQTQLLSHPALAVLQMAVGLGQCRLRERDRESVYARQWV